MKVWWCSVRRLEMASASIVIAVSASLILVDIVTGQCRRSVLGDGLVIDTDHTGIARHQHSCSGKRLQYADCNRVRSHDERIRHVISMIVNRFLP